MMYWMKQSKKKKKIQSEFQSWKKFQVRLLECEFSHLTVENWGLARWTHSLTFSSIPFVVDYLPCLIWWRCRSESAEPGVRTNSSGLAVRGSPASKHQLRLEYGSTCFPQAQLLPAWTAPICLRRRNTWSVCYTSTSQALPLMSPPEPPSIAEREKQGSELSRST